MCPSSSVPRNKGRRVSWACTTPLLLLILWGYATSPAQRRQISRPSPLFLNLSHDVFQGGPDRCDKIRWQRNIIMETEWRRKEVEERARELEAYIFLFSSFLLRLQIPLLHCQDHLRITESDWNESGTASLSISRAPQLFLPCNAHVASHINAHIPRTRGQTAHSHVSDTRAPPHAHNNKKKPVAGAHACTYVRAPNTTRRTCSHADRDGENSRLSAPRATSATMESFRSAQLFLTTTIPANCMPGEKDKMIGKRKHSSRRRPSMSIARLGFAAM